MVEQKRPLNYGRGEASIDLVDPADVLETLLAAFASPHYQPPVFPATAMDLLALTRHPKVEFAAVAALLEKDPLVTAKVMKIAQSPIYARGASLVSVRDAVIRLGLETMSDIFLSVTMNMRVFRVPGYEKPMQQLRRHSAMVANVARVICRRTSVYEEYAFLCGLLHDVGIAAGAAAIGARAPFDMAWPAILEAHAEAGRKLCATWGLPPDVGYVVADHHVTSSRPLHPVGCAVVIAEWIAYKLGFALEGDGTDVVPSREIASLGINDRMMREIRNEAVTIAERVNAG